MWPTNWSDGRCGHFKPGAPRKITNLPQENPFPNISKRSFFPLPSAKMWWVGCCFPTEPGPRISGQVRCICMPLWPLVSLRRCWLACLLLKTYSRMVLGGWMVHLLNPRPGWRRPNLRHCGCDSLAGYLPIFIWYDCIYGKGLDPFTIIYHLLHAISLFTKVAGCFFDPWPSPKTLKKSAQQLARNVLVDYHVGAALNIASCALYLQKTWPQLQGEKLGDRESGQGWLSLLSIQVRSNNSAPLVSSFRIAWSKMDDQTVGCSACGDALAMHWDGEECYSLSLKSRWPKCGWNSHLGSLRGLLCFFTLTQRQNSPWVFVSWCFWRSEVSQKGCSCIGNRPTLARAQGFCWSFHTFGFPARRRSLLSMWLQRNEFPTSFSDEHHKNEAYLLHVLDTFFWYVFWCETHFKTAMQHVFPLQRGHLRPSGASAHMLLGDFKLARFRNTTIHQELRSYGHGTRPGNAFRLVRHPLLVALRVAWSESMDCWSSDSRFAAYAQWMNKYVLQGGAP